MRLRIEPKEFFMYSVFLAFSKSSPDGEDTPVKEYLAQWELEPKAQGTDVIGGEDFDVMYFGGCYLGRHLKTIEDMQRAAVEEEMLTLEIKRALHETGEPGAGDTEEAAPTELVERLVREFHQESSFGTDEQGYLRVTLEPGVIRRRFTEMVG